MPSAPLSTLFKINKPINQRPNSPADLCRTLPPLCQPPEPPVLCRQSSALWHGADRSRTDDLLNANQALSQLSYGPALQETEDRTRGSGARKKHNKRAGAPSWLLVSDPWLLNGGPG